MRLTSLCGMGIGECHMMSLRQNRRMQRQASTLVLEKTCANSLRVPFLQAIFPDAKFIFIVRNGYDVTASAAKRWTSSIELPYLLKKVKYVPKGDIRYYFVRFVKNRVKQFFSKKKRMPVWGPVYKGMPEDAKVLSLEEVCAKQWARCVEKAHNDLAQLSSGKVYSMDYEAFVQDPAAYIHDIKTWLGFSWTDEAVKESVKGVRTGSVGKGVKGIDGEKKAKLDNIIQPVMQGIYTKIQKSVPIP